MTWIRSEVEILRFILFESLTMLPEPVAYRIGQGDREVGIATDMGVYDEYIVKNLEGLDALLLEANHDVNMLQVGKYPYYLKRRILGDKGHLSNETARTVALSATS